jgi:hypothetical protein
MTPLATFVLASTAIVLLCFVAIRMAEIAHVLRSIADAIRSTPDVAAARRLENRVAAQDAQIEMLDRYHDAALERERDLLRRVDRLEGEHRGT